MSSSNVTISSPSSATRRIAVPKAISRTAAASSRHQAKNATDSTDESVCPAFEPALDSMCGNTLGESSRSATASSSQQAEASTDPTEKSVRSAVNAVLTPALNSMCDVDGNSRTATAPLHAKGEGKALDMIVHRPQKRSLEPESTSGDSLDDPPPNDKKRKIGEGSRTAAASSSPQAKNATASTDESVCPALNPALDSMCGDSVSESSSTAAQKRKVLELDSQHGEPSSGPPSIVKKRKIVPRRRVSTFDERFFKTLLDEPATADGVLNFIASAPSTPIQVPPLEVQHGEQASKRKTDTTPLHTSAPVPQTESRRNVIDWSSKDVVAMALGDLVHLYNLRNNDHYTIGYSFSCAIGAVSFDPNGHILAVSTNDLGCAENNMLHFYDPESKKLLKTLEIPAEDGEIIALAWHPVRKMISVGTSEGCIYHFSNVLEKKHGVLKVEVHHLAVYGLVWRSDGSLLASSSDDGHVHVWRMESLAETVYSHEHQSAVRALAWYPWSPHVLAFGGGVDDRSIHKWNIKEHSCVEAFIADSRVTSLHWSRHYGELVSIHGMPYPKICIWSSTDYGKKIDIPAHEDLILHSAIDPSMGKLVTFCTDKKTVKFWDVYTSRKLKPLSVDFLLKEKKAHRYAIKEAQEEVSLCYGAHGSLKKLVFL